MGLGVGMGVGMGIGLGGAGAGRTGGAGLNCASAGPLLSSAMTPKMMTQRMR
jgi:hypothetical protein